MRNEYQVVASLCGVVILYLFVVLLYDQVILWPLVLGSDSTARLAEKVTIWVIPLILAMLLPVTLRGRQLWLVSAGGIGTVTIACTTTSLFLDPRFFPLAGVVMIAAGWIVTNIVTLRNSRINHTFNVLIELRTSAQLHTHRKNIFSKLGYDTQLRPSTVRLLMRQRTRCSDWEENYPVIESLAFIANLYENIAYGVRCNDLDLNVVRMTVRNLIVFFYEDYFNFIRYHHERDRRRFEHLIWLAELFGASKYDDLMKQTNHKPSRFYLNGEKLERLTENASAGYKRRCQKRIDRRLHGKKLLSSIIGRLRIARK